MSVFGTIRDAIFGKKKSLDSPSAGAPEPAPTPQPHAPHPQTTSLEPRDAAAKSPMASTPAPTTQVNVASILDTRAQSAGQSLNWRTSIVDLMKLLGLDSSLENRKELARELGYTGDMGDSAAMNVWLHRQVMRELAENGGIVPAELKG